MKRILRGIDQFVQHERNLYNYIGVQIQLEKGINLRFIGGNWSVQGYKCSDRLKTNKILFSIQFKR